MPRSRPPLTVAQILAWADAHWRHTGSWPNVRGTYRVRGWPTKVHTVWDQTTTPRGSAMPKKPCQPLCRALPKFGNLCHVYRWMLLLACWSFSGAAWGGPIHVQLGMPGDVPVPADYDGDGKADPAVFRRTSPSTAQWFIDLSSSGMTTVTFGAGSLDQPVPADYDGDKKADIAVYRPSTGQWFIDGSRSGLTTIPFGARFIDQPFPADYDGDGKADPALFRPSTGQWFIDGSSSGVKTATFGSANLDQPVPADYDGDKKADMAVYRPSTGQWFIDGSSYGVKTFTFGGTTASGTGLLPVPADYDGDGKADLALFSPSTGQWFIDGSSSGVRVLTFDPPGDLPVPADYTGDGAADLAVFNPGGEWSILPSPLATAAPEPSSWCLLTLGALSLVVGRKGLPRLCSTWRTSLPLT